MGIRKITTFSCPPCRNERLYDYEGCFISLLVDFLAIFTFCFGNLLATLTDFSKNKIKTPKDLATEVFIHFEFPRIIKLTENNLGCMINSPVEKRLYASPLQRVFSIFRF